MKSIWTSLVAILFLCVSCGQENDFQSEIDNNVENITTKNATTELPDPISQLVGMPINIMQPEGTINSKYMGYNLEKINNPTQWYAGDRVKLYKNDDNSGQQKWILTKLSEKRGDYDVYEIHPMVTPKTGENYLKACWTSNGSTYSIDLVSYPSSFTGPSTGLGSDSPHQYKWLFINDTNNTDLYELVSFTDYWDTKYWKDCPHFFAGNYQSNTGDYQSEQIFAYNSYLNLSNRLTKWKLSPSDTFTLESIEYLMEPEDLFEQMPDFVTTSIVENNTSIEQSMTTSFSQKATESSNFSNTEGISITTSGGVSVGIPGIFGGKFDKTTVSNKTWTYGKTESKEDSQTYSFPVKVPPYMTVIAVASVQRYSMNVTYIAKFKGNTTKRTLTLGGKWSGVRASTISYKLTESKTNKVLKSFTNTPTSIVDLTK